MVLWVLQLKAEAEGIDRLWVEEDYLFCLDVNSPSGTPDTLKDHVTINYKALQDVPNSRAQAHLVCKFDGRPASLVIQPFKLKSTPDVTTNGAVLGALDLEKEEFQGIVGLECRGLNPVQFHFGKGFNLRGVSGHVWRNVDLSSKDFFDVDPVTQQPVSLSSLEARFST